METKKCTDCGLLKTIDEFSKKGFNINGTHRLQSRCKKCQKIHYRAYYLRDKQRHLLRNRITRSKRRDFYKKIKQFMVCEKCGESSIECLDFRHKDKEEKDRCVSDMINRCLKEDKIIEEIKKCSILCANCHRKLHHLLKIQILNVI